MTPEPTSSLSVLTLTQYTIVPTPLTIHLDTLTLNESRTEHIHKGHQRHGHPQLATHITTRSQSIHRWIHIPHTPIEILSEIPLKDSLHQRNRKRVCQVPPNLNYVRVATQPAHRSYCRCVCSLIRRSNARWILELCAGFRLDGPVLVTFLGRRLLA